MSMWAVVALLAWCGSGLGLVWRSVPGARVRDVRDVIVLLMVALCGPLLWLSVLVEDAFRKRAP
jgi:hypothetical protein